MIWIYEHQRTWRLAVLGLFLVAILGPWTYDLIVVTAEYPCDIRLEGDYCGIPLAGMWIILALVGEFFYRIGGLVTGATALSDLGRVILHALGVLVLLLPFFSTLGLVLPGERRRGQVFQAAAWGLAAIASVWFLLSVSQWPQPQLWGVWLYILLALSVLVLEVMMLAIQRGLSQAKQ